MPNRADASLMIRMLTGEVEPAMPPKDNPQPTEAEINVLRAWINAGAQGPNGEATDYPELATPKIKPATGVHQYLTSLALSPDGKRLALGRFRNVELVDPVTSKVVAKTKDLPGKVNNISYSADGKTFVAASGIPGLYGVATICKAADGTIVSQIKGHKDALYDACLSPNGETLATCSYDREINLWDVKTGKLVRTLTGHNGAIFALAFSKDGSILASASADATVKLWNVKTGERLDTLGQPESEQCAAAFTPDGTVAVVAGVLPIGSCGCGSLCLASGPILIRSSFRVRLTIVRSLSWLSRRTVEGWYRRRRVANLCCGTLRRSRADSSVREATRCCYGDFIRTERWRILRFANRRIVDALRFATGRGDKPGSCCRESCQRCRYL